MNAVQPTTPQRPSHEQWETVRFFISKLWCEEKETLPSIILRLRDDHNLLASPKTLKTKLQEWGLIKKMNLQDAEDLLAAQARLEALGQTGLLLLRGRVEQIKRVHDYQRRRGRARGHHLTTTETATNSALSQVVTLSCYPRLRPEPTLALLTKFESLLREMQYLLHAAKRASMCIPGRTTLDWQTSTTESERLERSLYYCTWEGTRAFEERDFTWAGLCWQSALLDLEDLIWESDLNIWICFIRGCVRLARSQATEVAQQFLSKLRWLQDELPSSAPHRALIHALSKLPLSDLVNGCIFALEANLRNMELLWPLETNCRIEYQLHLEEERLCQGFGSSREIPQVYDSNSLGGLHVWQDNSMQRSLVSACMLQRDYNKAGMFARSTISQLEREQSSHADNQQGKVTSASLAYWYLLLGTVQYRQGDHTQCRNSYLKCLQFYQESEAFHLDHALQPTQIRRVLVVLRWLNATLRLSQEDMNVDFGAREQKLETEFNLQLQGRENTPFRRQLDRAVKFPTKVDASKMRGPRRDRDLGSVPERARVVQRPVLLGVDLDKDQNMDVPDAMTVRGWGREPRLPPGMDF